MRRWFRRVLPSSGMLGLFCIAYVGIAAACWFESWLLQGVPRSDILLARDLLLVVTATVYGMGRVGGAHPVWNREYCEWLERTPWTIEKPLPLGPVQLVPQDAIVLFVLFLLAQYEPFLVPARLPVLFLCGYLGMLALTLAATGQIGFSYALAFGLGLVVWCWTNWQVALAISLVLYLVALAGLRLSLLCFPWRLSKVLEAHVNPKRNSTPAELRGSAQTLGWPVNRLSPKSVSNGIGYRDGVGLSLLAGWWLYVSVSLYDELVVMRPDALESATMVPVFAGWLLVIYRIASYCGYYRPPISLLGRIYTHRWIIPGYDRVFVAPLLAFVVPLALGGAFIHYAPFPPAVCAAVPVTVCLLILVNMGPTLKEWALTGSHRVVPGYSQQTGKQSHFIRI